MASAPLRLVPVLMVGGSAPRHQELVSASSPLRCRRSETFNRSFRANVDDDHATNLRSRSTGRSKRDFAVSLLVERLDREETSSR